MAPPCATRDRTKRGRRPTSPPHAHAAPAERRPPPHRRPPPFLLRRAASKKHSHYKYNLKYK
eukprot:scaffold2641_cov380-Prasinococcus_capsulatus_cf.AAC.4